jgi:hypothetical protein
MNNYTIIKNEEYEIHERPTGLVVYRDSNKRNAHKRLAHLNMGGMFDGWTPKFFLVEMPEIILVDGE